MTISFTVNEAPYVKRACVEVFPELKESDFAEDWYELGSDGRRYMEVPDYPEVVITEGSAVKLFGLAGMGHLNPSCGELSPQAQTAMFATLFKARNDLSKIKSRTEPGKIVHNCIEVGYSVERLQRLIDSFMQLLRYCRENQKTLIWG